MFFLFTCFFSTSEPSTLKHSETEIMLGRCDSVHSGVAMAFVAVGIVGLTVVSTLGLMGYFGVPNGTWDEGNGDFWDFLGYLDPFASKLKQKHVQCSGRGLDFVVVGLKIPS